jgi:hypothetical protein
MNGDMSVEWEALLQCPEGTVPGQFAGEEGLNVNKKKKGFFFSESPPGKL